MISTKSNVKKTNPIKPNTNPIQTQTNPITKRPKMNVNKVLTRGYENKRLFRRAENKPNQTQFQTQRSSSRTGNNILLFMPNVGYNTLYYCFLLYFTPTSDDK